MNKKFLSFLLITLFVGLLLGYAGEYIIQMGAEPTIDKRPAVRRFGDTITAQQKSNTGAGKRNMLQLSEDDAYLLSLSKMNVEGILAEINRIRKNSNAFPGMRSLDYFALNFLFSRFAQKAPRQALEYLKNTPELNSIYKYTILEAWFERNPEAAMAFCLEAIEGIDEYSSDFIITKSSPEKAWEWIQARPEKEKNSAMYVFFNSVCKSHPEKIAAFISQGEIFFNEDPRLKMRVAEQWLKEDKEAAMKWINSFPEEAQIKAKAIALGMLPLEEATRELDSLTGKAKEAALLNIVNAQGYKKPQQALEWLIKNSPPDIESFRNVVDQLYFANNFYCDPDIQTYITKLPQGEQKDALLAKLATEIQTFVYRYKDSLQEPNMQDVISYTAQIGDQRTREISTTQLLNTWINLAPEEARQWINKSDLSPEKKKEHLEHCDLIFKE